MTPREQFNEALLETFSTPAGQRALAGLVNIVGLSVEPTETDRVLWHREGQRALVGMIMKGMQDERERRRNAVGGPEPAGGEQQRAGARKRSAGRRSTGRGA